MIAWMSAPVLAAAPGPTPMPLWPEGAPGAKGTEPADVPTIAVFPAANTDGPAAAIIVCPGGGYGGLAPHEGDPIAQWLNSAGITGVVLRYRHSPGYRHPAPLQDAQQAIRTVRARAKEWNIDPHKVGILGFSAGGHLAATASTQFDGGKPDAPDAIDRQSSRPDVSVLVYPVITFSSDKKHAGSQRNLLGDDAPKELVDSMSAERRVTDKTPPAFIFHTMDDGAVPFENSVMYTMALREHHIPCELHLYEHGRHGVGLAKDDASLQTWPDLCVRWLTTHGFGRTATAPAK